IKVISSRFQSDGRFLREARFVAQLSHPNIAKILDVGHTDEAQYIVMEFIKGISIREYLTRIKPFTKESYRKLAQIFSELAGALQHAHQHGIIHRDVKPSNILIDDHERPVLLDFGVAKRVMSEDEAHLTQDGGYIGTPAYSSPEQFAGAADS